MEKIKKTSGYAIFGLIALAVGFVLSTLKYPVGSMLVLALGAVCLLTPFIIDRPQFGIFLIGFFLPFERIPVVEIGSITLKINHILIIITLISCLLALFSSKVKIPKDSVRTAIIFFLLALAASLPVAINMSRALQVYAFMLLMGAVYFIVTVTVNTKEALMLAIKGVLWGALVSGVFALVQFGGDMIGLPNEITLLKEGYDKSTFGFARVQAFSQEPLYFANYLFIPLFMLLILNIKDLISSVFSRTLSYILLVILLVDFILTVSRGAYLAAGVTVVLFVITQAKTIINWKTITVGITVLFFVATGAYLALARSESRAIDEFIAHVAVEDREEGESVVMRLSSASRAYEAFLDKPIFGNGLGNFGPLVQGDPDSAPEETGWAIVNNEYLELLAEGGLVALISFIIIIMVVAVRAIKAFLEAKDDFVKASIYSLGFAMLAVLVQYATFSTLYIIHVWFLLGLLAAASNIILSKNVTK